MYQLLSFWSLWSLWHLCLGWHWGWRGIRCWNTCFLICHSCLVSIFILSYSTVPMLFHHFDSNLFPIYLLSSCYFVFFQFYLTLAFCYSLLWLISFTLIYFPLFLSLSLCNLYFNFNSELIPDDIIKFTNT